MESVKRLTVKNSRRAKSLLKVKDTFVDKRVIKNN